MKKKYIDLKECELVEILKIQGGARIIVKRIPEDSDVECTFDDCEEGLAEYITLALGINDYIGYCCERHLEAIHRLIDECIPLERSR